MPRSNPNGGTLTGAARQWMKTLRQGGCWIGSYHLPERNLTRKKFSKSQFYPNGAISTKGCSPDWL